MKKISTGGKVVGVLEILVAVGLIVIYFLTNEDVRMDRFLDDQSTTIPVLCLVSGTFKLFGVILIFLKNKLGIASYFIGNFALISFFFYISREFNFSESDEMLPILILYGGIALQFWFIYIMSKTIQEK